MTHKDVPLDKIKLFANLEFLQKCRKPGVKLYYLISESQGSESVNRKRVIFSQGSRKYENLNFVKNVREKDNTEDLCFVDL